MEQVAALVAQKMKRMEMLENRKTKTEQEKAQIEIALENLEDRLDSNNQYLDELLKKSQLGKDSQNDLSKLITKNILTLLVIIFLSCIMNTAIGYAAIIYIAIYIPKYIVLINNIRLSSNKELITSISSLKNEIRTLELDKDKIIASIRKLNYTLDDIDVEKKVLQDILTFVLEKKTDGTTEATLAPETNLNLTRVNPCV